MRDAIENGITDSEKHDVTRRPVHNKNSTQELDLHAKQVQPLLFSL